MHIRLVLLAAAVIMLFAAAATAETTIYTWTDKNGVKRMSNMPPVDSEVEFQVLETRPTQVIGDPVVPYIQVNKATPKKLTTRVKIINNHVIVPVTLSYNNREVKTNLLLDTGASNITLHKEKTQDKKPAEGLHTGCRREPDRCRGRCSRCSHRRAAY